MVELMLVSSNLEDERKVLNSDIVDKFYFSFIDSNSALTKKEAYNLKTDWGAKKEPFALIKHRDKILRCFYTEKTDNVIDEALQFIKGLQETYD